MFAPHRLSRRAGVVAGLAALAALGAAAAAQTAATNDNQPLQIQADSGIEWQQQAHLYIARGNAVAARGSAEIHADTLVAHYREVKSATAATAGKAGANPVGNAAMAPGGNTEIYRVEAEGHVLLKRDAQNVVGDRAIYDIDRAIAVITGGNLKLTTPTDTVTARDSLEWYDQKQVAVARGNAVAIRNGKTIKADILTAYMVKTAAAGGNAGSTSAPAAKPAPAASKSALTRAAAPGPAPESSKINRVDAQGHVVVTNGPDTGRGDFGVYNAETGIATLIGNVVIERGKDVIRGQRGVMDLNKNISRMLPGGMAGTAPQRVQGLFVREDHGTRPGSGAPAGGAAAGPPSNGPGHVEGKR